ncbi:MAG: YceI family protein [Saprospiraceae bacterium]|nr:YceI family protein [Saprospiraceae bacterium]
MKYLLSITFIGVLFFSFISIQNQTLHYKVNEDFSMKIKGSSNVHDWESDIDSLSGSAAFSFSETGEFQITQCKVVIPVKSIKSSKGKRMDKKTMKAFNEKEYPIIEYNLTHFDKLVMEGNLFHAEATGDLSLAGAKKSIVMEIKGKKLDDGKYEITGVKDMKMTDFSIKPPTALLGTMRTKDDISVEFRVVLDMKE